MRNAMKVIVLVGALAIVAAGIGTAAATLTTPTSSTSIVPSALTTSGVDGVKGPCDEAEHANDPECAGPQVPEDDPTVPPSGLEDLFGDISGPCDEAEHVNDPRCTGAPGADDNSGPGNGDEEDDESGPSENSGPGNADDDDEDEDHSGSG